jgi:hypothetical protein
MIFSFTFLEICVQEFKEFKEFRSSGVQEFRVGRTTKGKRRTGFCDLDLDHRGAVHSAS